MPIAMHVVAPAGLVDSGGGAPADNDGDGPRGRAHELSAGRPANQDTRVRRCAAAAVVVGTWTGSV
jgi:hypothetical protein